VLYLLARGGLLAASDALSVQGENDMSDLIVVGFDGTDEADKVLLKLNTLKKEYLIDLEDAVVVVRDESGKIHLKQSMNLTAIGATSGLLSGSLWGGLVGLLFLNPLAGFAIGGAIGAGTGALSGSLADYGIDDDFIKSLGETIPNNSSALFVLVRKVQPEKVLAEFSGLRGKVLKTSLSPDQEAKLQAALSGTEPASPAPGTF
jgi:uncharacterized membrane protein